MSSNASEGREPRRPHGEKAEERGPIWVIKVGSSLVTAGGCGVDRERLAEWGRQLRVLIDAGVRCVWVTSGSIAEGMRRLGWAAKPKRIDLLQAAAAVGQMGLMQAYGEEFMKAGVRAAQLLLTHEDVSHRRRYLNAQATIKALLDLGVVPVVNENDTIATAEIKLGDNDTLGALIANLVGAERLIIMTDQVGLYDKDPRAYDDARLISEISADRPDLEAMAGGAGTGIGTGGMLTKVRAAKRAAESGCDTRVMHGKTPDGLVRVLNGESLGTLFTHPDSAQRAKARERWLLSQLRFKGKLDVDAGCERALLQKGASLLPIGCVGVEGDFLRGDLVQIVNESGTEIARGIANYGASEAKRLIKTPSSEIELVLGYALEDELVHRDRMAISAPREASGAGDPGAGDPAPGGEPEC